MSKCIDAVLADLAAERVRLQSDRSTGASDVSLDFVIAALSSGERRAEVRRLLLDQWELTAPLSDEVVRVEGG